MNSTIEDSAISNMKDYYIVCSLSLAFGLISIIISVLIVIIVRRTKPRLHTVRHLLICNTCLASIVFCIVQTADYIILIFFPWITDDVSCRWRGYLTYVSISAASYSYLVQAISRLFFSTFATKYPWVTTFKVHYILITAHWIVVIVIPLPSIITNDIYFRPGILCLVPIKHIIHVAATVLGYYMVPVFAIAVLYIYIYRRIKKAKKRAELIRNTTNDKRDLEVLRNITILLCIYLTGGIPGLIFVITSIDFFYFATIVAVTLSMMIEKICTILLDRELRQVTKDIIFSRNRIMPSENTITRTGHLRHTTHLQHTS